MKPNIVGLMSDQQRSDRLACLGGEIIRTPNQIRSSDRATLFSGLYARKHGLAHSGTAIDEVWKSAVTEEFHYNTWMTNRACEYLETAQKYEPFLSVCRIPGSTASRDTH